MDGQGVPSRSDTSGLSYQLALIQPEFNTICGVCGRANCTLNTHRAFLVRTKNQGFRQHDVTPLMNTSFATSYSFNPLSVASDFICGQLQFDFDANGLGDQARLPSALHKLISYDITQNVPFYDPSGNPMGEVAAEWLVATSVDEIACASTLNLWMMIEWTNTKNPILERYSSKLTTLFLELLRKRIENKDAVSVGTLFAASNHFAICQIFFEQTNEQREIMMNGLEALVNARGGFERLTDSSHPGLFQSLLWADVMYAWLSGKRPRFRVRNPPPMPHSLIPERSAASVVPEVYHRCCGPDLLNTARYLRLFLLFRPGSEVRELSKTEYQYMVSLERWVHVQLLEQTARYLNTDTPSECLVIAMGLVRMCVLCVWEQHVNARKVYTQRLYRALQQVDISEWRGRDAANALTWVCWVLLTQSQKHYDREYVVSLLVDSLRDRFGETWQTWPEDWETRFTELLQPLLWHSDYDKFTLFVTKLVIDHSFGRKQH